MPASAGQRQEDRLFKYLRIDRQCVQVIQGDQAVRTFLGMKGTPKCADAIGLHQAVNAPGPKRFTIGESKGTDMDSAVEQLGNAAAGIYAKFGREAKIDLLVMAPSLTLEPGFLSPGPGYAADPLKTGLNKFTLQEAKGEVGSTAKPRVTYTDWMSWASAIAQLRIVVLTLK
jgi:hypothetical protein